MPMHLPRPDMRHWCEQFKPFPQCDRSPCVPGHEVPTKAAKAAVFARKRGRMTEYEVVY